MPYLNYQQPYQQSFQQYQQPFQNYNGMPPVASIPQQSFQSQPTQSSGLTWVQGDIGARAYPVTAGTSALLMDSEGQNFFIKSADASGMPTMKKYAYSEVVEEPMKLESHAANDYDTAHLASREEVKQLQDKIKELEEQIQTMTMQAEVSKTTGGKKNAAQ